MDNLLGTINYFLFDQSKLNMFTSLKGKLSDVKHQVIVMKHNSLELSKKAQIYETPILTSKYLDRVPYFHQ